MRILGLEISRARKKAAVMSSVDSRGGWWPVIQESFAGAWQQNVEVNIDMAYSYYVVWSCATLIAGDIGKLDLMLMRRNGRVWDEEDNPAYSPVLRKPNPYQTRQKFVETWLFSKLLRGNAYILKQRDNRGVVTGLYPLHPDRVHPLVAPDGSVFYQIDRDDLARAPRDIAAAPASEVIHDPMYTLFHPLVGVSPLYACALAATQGLAIQQNGKNFFSNAAMPSGVLTAPAQIADETAARLKREWEANYSGTKLGRIAVLGDGLKFDQMTMSALDAQLVQQAEMSDRAICSAFHVPAFKVGVGPMPAHDNIEALDQQYYSQCLQTLLESFESHLDEGLGLARDLRTEFDLDDLLRMDTSRKVEAVEKMVGAGFLSPDEARAKFNFGPVDGGDSPYMQQQNYSLAALAERDRNSPLAAAAVAPVAPAEPVEPEDEEDDEEDDDAEEDAVEAAVNLLGTVQKGLVWQQT